jgi:type I restriction enzyme S subunit
MTWDEVLLGDIVTLKRGYDLPTKDRRSGSVPVVSSSGITGCHDQAKVDGPGVVTGRYGTLGEVFFIQEPFWPLNTTLYVQDFKGNDPRWVSYFLRMQGFGTRSGAAAVPGINRNALHMLPARRPPLESQRKVAAILGAYDELIENNLRHTEILEEIVQTTYREWFVNYHFPGSDITSLIDSPVGRIPRGWDIATLLDVVEIDANTPRPASGKHPFVPMTSLVERSMLVSEIQERAPDSGLTRFMKGDTLFPGINPSLQNGKTAFVGFLEDGQVGLGSTEFIVMRSRRDAPEWVYCFARTQAFRDTAIKSMTGASGRQRVKKDTLKQYPLAVPPSDVVAAFCKFAAPMFNLVENLRRMNVNLGATRGLLLPRLISGELDVSDLDIDTSWLAA